MSYLLNPESLERLKKDAVPAIEKELVAMSKNSQLRVAQTMWGVVEHRLATTAGDRSREFDSIFDSNITVTRP
jgi:hypothetical protein